MQKIIKYIVSFLVSFVLTSCSNSILVKPLAKDQQYLSFNFGGPIVKVKKVNLPIPLTSITYAQGLDTNLTIFDNFHTTSAIFKTFHNDIGALYNVYKNDGIYPGISIAPIITLMTNFNLPDTKIYPNTNINIYYDFKDYTFYSGTNILLELSKNKAFNEKIENRVLYSPFLGIIYTSQEISYTLEVKYLLPNISNENIVTEYASFGKNGVIGVYFSIGLKL